MKDCPQAKPYYNGTLCITCSSNEYFNLKTRKCQTCETPYAYDPTQRDCIDHSEGQYQVQSSALKSSSTLFSHQQELLNKIHSRQVHFRHDLARNLWFKNRYYINFP